MPSRKIYSKDQVTKKTIIRQPQVNKACLTKESKKQNIYKSKRRKEKMNKKVSSLRVNLR